VLIDPHEVVAGLYNVDPAAIKGSVAYALEGVLVGEANFGSVESMDIRVRNQAQFRRELNDLAVLPILSSTGQVVQLEQVAGISRTQRPHTIHHRDGRRVINIRAQLEPGVLANDVKAAMVQRLRPDLSVSRQQAMVRDREDRILVHDDAVLIEFGGENEVRDDAMDDLMVSLGIAACLMFVVLTVRFNSLIQPLIVLFSLPLSLIGVSIGLVLCGLHFSLAAMIGIVAMSGIVVNDAIVLVDFINQMKRRGVPMHKAVVYAGQLRLRPIMLTTVTTIAGLLPLAVNISGGGEFFQPLTVTMIFGIGFATLLQLFIIPMMCYSFDPTREPIPSPKPAPGPAEPRRPLASLALPNI
jgi:HAE1 family hydrophobic/amphiphilic exporter-1